MKKWTFITSHGAVLALIAKHGEIKAIEIATALGITERSVRRITADLEAKGYLHKTRNGRVNRYEVNPKLLLRHPESQDINITIGEVLWVLLSSVGNEDNA